MLNYTIVVPLGKKSYCKPLICLGIRARVKPEWLLLGSGVVVRGRYGLLRGNMV